MNRMIMKGQAMNETRADDGKAKYLVRKGGWFYRENSCGYTDSPRDAGRYTLTEAENIAGSEPLNFTVYEILECHDPLIVNGKHIEIFDDKAGGAALLIDGATVDLTGLPSAAVDVVRGLYEQAIGTRQDARIEKYQDLLKIVTPKMVADRKYFIEMTQKPAAGSKTPADGVGPVPGVF